MTREKAEKFLLNDIETDEETGDVFSWEILSYNDKDSTSNCQIFNVNVLSNNKIVNTTEVYISIVDGELVAIVPPTN